MSLLFIFYPSISSLLTYVSIAAAVDVNNTFFSESLAVLEHPPYSVSYITIHAAQLLHKICSWKIWANRLCVGTEGV